MEDGRLNQSQKVRKVQPAEPPTKALQAELAEVDLVRSTSTASQKSGTGKFSRGPSILFKPISSSSSFSTTSSIKPISAIKRVFVKRSASKTSSSSLHANVMDASAIPSVPPISVQSPRSHEQSAATNVVHIPSGSVQSSENHGKPSEDNVIKTPVSIASTQQPQRQPKVANTPLASNIVSDLMDFQQASLSYLDTNSHTHAHAPKYNNYGNKINRMRNEKCNHTRNIQTMRQLHPLLGFSHSCSYEEEEEEPFDQMAPPLKMNPPPTNTAKTADPSYLPDQGAVSSPKPSKPVLILGSPTRGSSFDSGIGAEPPPRLSLSHDTRNKPKCNNHGKEWFHHHQNDGDDTTAPSESESTSLSSKPVLLLGAAGRPKSNLMPPTPVVVTPPRLSRAGLGYSSRGGDSHSFGIDRVGSRDGSRCRSRSQSRNRYKDGNRYLFRDDVLPSDDSEEEGEEDLSREERYSRHQRQHQREQGEQRHVRERRHSRELATQRKGTAHSNSDTRRSDTPDMLQQLADAALFDAPKILAEAPMVFSNYMNGLIDRTKVSQKGSGLDGSAGAGVGGGVAGATYGNNGGDESDNGKENNSKESDDGSNNININNEEINREESKPTPKEATTSPKNNEVQSETKEVAPTPKESTTNPTSPRRTRARSPDIFQQLTDAALFNMMDAPAVVSQYVNGIFSRNNNENHDEEEDENNTQEETLDSLILKGFQNYGEHDPNSSEVTLEEMIFSGFTSGLNVVPRIETEEVLTEEEIDERIMSGLVKGKIIDLAVEKYYSEEATAKNNADNEEGHEIQEVDDQWPIQIGNKLYTHEEAMQMWMRAKKKSGEVSSEETIPESKEALKDAILAELMADRLREYKRVNEEKFGRLGVGGPTEDEIDERGYSSRYRYIVGLKRGRHFDEGGVRRSRSPIIHRNENEDGDVKRNASAHGVEIDNGGGNGKKENADTDVNATTMNDNGIANDSANANVAGISSGGDNSHNHGARQSLVRFQEEEEPVSNPHEVSTPKQTSNKKSPARPVSLDRLMTEFQYKKDVTKYDDETTEVANNARKNIAANSVSSNISAKKLFREEAESANVSAKDTPFHHSSSTFRQRQEAIIEEIIRKTYAEDTPKTENKTVPSPPISTKEANTTTVDSSPAKDSVLGSNYGVEVSSIHGINPRFITSSKTGGTTKGGESFLGSQFGTEVVVKPEKLVTERKPRTLASHNMNVRDMSRLSVKGFGGARQNLEGGKSKGAALEGKSTLPPPISEVKVKTKKTNPLKKLGIKKSSKA